MQSGSFVRQAGRLCWNESTCKIWQCCTTRHRNSEKHLLVTNIPFLWYFVDFEILFLVLPLHYRKYITPFLSCVSPQPNKFSSRKLHRQTKSEMLSVELMHDYHLSLLILSRTPISFILYFQYL